MTVFRPSRHLRDVRQSLKRIPAFRAWRERRYERLFESDEAYGYFRGVFPSFDAAVRSAPRSRALGFDLPQYARMFDERHTRVFSYDYPVLFWLQSIVAPGLRVFDFGGHVGVQFYGYQKYLTFPPGLQWRVCDVPAVVEQGREHASRRGESGRLSFTTTFADGDGFDVLVAAGSLQFVESPSLAQSLAALRAPPRHLLVNKVPLGAGPAFVTLQNAGTSFVPQHVFERRAFIEDLTRLGYEVVDEWEDRVHSCHVPFHPERAIPHYSGMYLRRP